MAYGELETEGELETITKDKAPSTEWPEKGGIELHKMKFKYALEYPYVLKSLSLTIKPCEKVCKTRLVVNSHIYLHRLALWVGLELASLLYCQHCSD